MNPMVRLLFVDDDIDLTDLFRELLCGEGYEVLTVNRADEALWALPGFQPAIAVIDVNMPEMDGPTLALQMKLKGYGEIPVVFLSGQANLAQIAATAGTPYFLVKPICINVFLSTLDSILRRTAKPTVESDADLC